MLAGKHGGIVDGMAELLNRLRDAIEASGESRYRISKGTGIAESVLSRFMTGETALTVETAERVAEYLGLEIILRSKRGTGNRRNEK